MRGGRYGQGFPSGGCLLERAAFLHQPPSSLEQIGTHVAGSSRNRKATAAGIHQWVPASIMTLANETWEMDLDLAVAASLIAVAVHLNFERAWRTFTSNPKKAIMAAGKKALALAGMPTPLINLLAEGEVAVTNLLTAVRLRSREIRRERDIKKGIAIGRAEGIAQGIAEGRAQLLEELGLPPETELGQDPKKEPDD